MGKVTQILTKEPIAITPLKVEVIDNLLCILFNFPVKFNKKSVSVPYISASLDNQEISLTFLTDSSTLLTAKLPSELGFLKVDISKQAFIGHRLDLISPGMISTGELRSRHTVLSLLFKPIGPTLSEGCNNLPLEYWENELQSVSELADIDECKWTYLGLVFIYLRISPMKCIPILEKLKLLDKGRWRYYHDIGTQFLKLETNLIVQEKIENNNTSSIELSGLNLYTIKLETLFNLETIDLSRNNLGTIAVRHLLNVSTLILDDNKLTHLDGIEECKNLRKLSVCNNLLATEELEALLLETNVELVWKGNISKD